MSDVPRALVRASIDQVARMMTTGVTTHVQCVLGVPDGARMLHAVYDYETLQFAFVFEHESFAEVPAGDLIPELRVTMRDLRNSK